MSFLTTDPALVAQLRQYFDQFGYSAANLFARLEQPIAWPIGALNPRLLPLFLHRTAAATPLDVLIRWFFLGLPQPQAHAEHVFAPAVLTDLLAGGLLVATEPGLTPTIKILPVEKVFVLGAIDSTDLPALTPSAHTFAQLAPRRSVGRVLDWDTGIGLHALLATEHATQVEALATQPHHADAVQFAVGFNRCPHLTCRLADTPHTDARYDLIVSQLPLDLPTTPAPTAVDAASPQRLQAVAQHLAPGGFAQVLCIWAHVRGQNPQDRLTEWLRVAECAAWVLHLDTSTPAEFVLHGLPASAEPGALSRWLQHLAAQQVEAVSTGVITLRKPLPQQPVWLRYDTLPARLGPCGADVERGFALRDFLSATRDPATLLAATVVRNPHLVWEQQVKPAGAGWAMNASQLRLTRGLAFTGQADSTAVGLADRCTGTRPLHAILTEMSLEAGTAGPEVFLSLVRGMIEQGFLLPPELVPSA
jgi:hypothetical protein